MTGAGRKYGGGGLCTQAQGICQLVLKVSG